MSRKFKKISCLLENTKIYDFVQISRDKVVAITMSEGVKVIMFDLKKMSRYEITSFRDTNKFKLMPYFHL